MADDEGMSFVEFQRQIDDVEKNDEDKIMATKKMTGPFGRELKSVEPDLEVIVGASEGQQQVFKCHSVLLASQSAYIDTMLSIPMQERATKKITFPDIEPDTWVRLLNYLTPLGGRELQVPDIPDVLPIYDKYEFQDGIDLCDEYIHYTIKLVIDDFTAFRYVSHEEFPHFTKALEMSHDMKLPKSKDRAVEYAEKILMLSGSQFILIGNEQEKNNQRVCLQRLLKLAGDKVVATIVKKVMAKEHLSTSEMRSYVQESSFPDLFSSRMQLLDEQNDMLQKLNVDRLIINGSGSSRVNGEYTIAYNRADGPIYGAMKKQYHKISTNTNRNHLGIMNRDDGGNDDNNEIGILKLEALDPFGKNWTISFYTENNSQEILYTWENEYTSLLPPKTGWACTDQGQHPPPDHIHYYIGS